MSIYKAIEQASVVIRDFDQKSEDENTRIGAKHFTGVLLCNENSTCGIYTSLFLDQKNQFTFSNSFPGSHTSLFYSAGLVDSTLEKRTYAETRMGTDIISPDTSLHVTIKNYASAEKIHAGKSVLIGAFGTDAMNSYSNFVNMHCNIKDDA